MSFRSAFNSAFAPAFRSSYNADVGGNLWLLDQYSDAAAAYSLRRLSAGVSKVVRVRRESDNNERDFTAKEVSNGTLQNWTNAQVTPPLDVRELTATGRDGDVIEAAAAYSLRNLSDSYAGDVVEVRRNTDGALKDFKASEVTDGTLEAWVNTSFANALPLDTASAAAAAYSLRNLSSSYTGSVVEVRRSSDDAVRSFTAAEVTDGTLVAWVGLENRLVQSENFSSNVWNKSSNRVSITSDLITAPDGEVTADLATWSTPSFSDGMSQATSVTAGTYTASIYLKYNGSQWVQMFFGSQGFGGGHGNFDLLNGVKGSSLGSSSIEDVGDGWYRCSVTRTTSISASTGLCATLTVSSGTVGRFGSGVAGSYYVWGAQLNKSSTAETYARATSGISGDGFVSKWYDQSGNDNHATQGTPASQPTIVDGGTLVSGGNKFDGTNDFLTFPDTFLSGSFAISSVFNLQDRSKSNNTLFGYSNSGNFIRYQGTNRLGIKINGAESFINSTLANNTDYVMSITRDASNLVSLYVDGSLMGSFTQSGLFSLDRIGVFSESSSYFLKGTVTETLIYPSDESDKRRAIEENIGSTYGITLPSSKDGTVSKWYDQSTTSGVPNANHAVQTSTASQPKIVSGGALVAGGLAFDGDFLSPSLLLPTIQNSFVTSVVTRRNTSTGYIAQLNRSTDRFYLRGALITLGDPAVNINTTLGNNEQSILSVTATTAGLFTGFKDGTSLGTTNYTGNVGGGDSTIGATNTGGTGFDGLIAEFIVYTSDQSDNRTALEANIGEVYGIAGIPAYDDTVNGFVETWYDQSGNGNNATQLTAGNQPKIVDGGSLVTGGLVFDGTNDRLSFASSVALSSNDFFVTSVVKVLEGDGDTIVLAGNVTGNRFLMKLDYDNNRLQMRADDGSFHTVTSFDVSEPTGNILVTVQRVSDTVSLFHQASNKGTFNVTGESFTLGNFGQWGPTLYSKHLLSEIIIYSTDQSANRLAIEANINNQYDIY